MRYSCIHLKKNDLKDSKWIFYIYFQRDILRKRFFFSFKKEEINLKTTKCMRQNIRQNKRKQNHQIKFLTTKQTKAMRRGPIIIIPWWPLEIKFETKSPN